MPRPVRLKAVPALVAVLALVVSCALVYPAVVAPAALAAAQQPEPPSSESASPDVTVTAGSLSELEALADKYERLERAKGPGKETQQFLIILGFLAIYLGLNYLFERWGLAGPYFRRWPDRKGRVKASKDVGGRFGMGRSILADFLPGFGIRGPGGDGFSGEGGRFGGGGASGSW